MADHTGASIRIDDADVRRLLGDLELAGRNLSDLMEQLAAQVEFDTARRFETQVDPDGNPWPPSLRALAENGETLTDTARLRQSITSSVSPTAFEVGTNVVYAAIHQFGGTVKKPARQQELFWHMGKDGAISDWRFVKRSKANYSETHTIKAHDVRIPARPFLGVGSKDQDTLTAIARDWLADTAGLGRSV